MSKIHIDSINNVSKVISLVIKDSMAGGTWRGTYAPGEIDKVTQAINEQAPEENPNLIIDQLNELWSEDDIEYYNNHIIESEPELTLESFKNQANYLIECHVDAVAKQRGYKKAESCASYGLSTKPEWKAEAECFIAWRDEVWEFVINQFTLIESGQAPVPALEDIVPSLPTITWPE